MCQHASGIKAVLLDVDGVLTDGRVGYGPGNAELKFFDIKDGLGITLLRRAGILVGIISGRSSSANRRRAEELQLDIVVEGRPDKLSAFEDVLNTYGLSEQECLYMGDDLLDLPVLRRVGISVAVADAVEEVRTRCDWVTRAAGGRGAVREVAERFLRERGQWQDLVRSYCREDT